MARHGTTKVYQIFPSSFGDRSHFLRCRFWRMHSPLFVCTVPLRPRRLGGRLRATVACLACWYAMVGAVVPREGSTTCLQHAANTCGVRVFSCHNRGIFVPNFAVDFKNSWEMFTAPNVAIPKFARSEPPPSPSRGMERGPSTGHFTVQV